MLSERAARGGAPLPLGFVQVFILNVVKVLCFDTLLQVLILNVVSDGPFYVGRSMEVYS
jgi:hypothetical protein